MRMRDYTPKMLVLIGLLFVYLALGGVFLVLVNVGVLHKMPGEPPPVDEGTDSGPVPKRIDPSESLGSAIAYVDANLKRPNGHIELYKKFYRGQNITWHNHTNSEAISYYLQIAAQQGNKTAFDSELQFMLDNMMHPTGGYIMWRLDDTGYADQEGQNIAPDAELRALHALYVAKDRWGDQKYDAAINRIATALERVAIDENNVLVAYGGMSGEKPWRAPESYLAYSDFQVYERLANTRGGVWVDVNKKMREITLESQIWNGLYNTVYFTDGRAGGPYGNHIDGGVYSINSLWIMVRFAESNDDELKASAQKSLDFYIQKYKQDGAIYVAYTSSGEIANQAQSPWAYALVGRAASALGDDSFAMIMERRMRDFQDLDSESPSYGAFIEGAVGDERVGQFTMQEAILTLQEIQNMAPRVHE